MMFTGTLIEDLIATVERAEANAQSNARELQIAAIEPWFASIQEQATDDSKFVGVA